MWTSISYGPKSCSQYWSEKTSSLWFALVRRGSTLGRPARYGPSTAKIKMCTDALPKLLACDLGQFPSAPVTAPRQFLRRVSRAHSKTQCRKPIVRRLNKRQQFMSLLHRFATGEGDPIGLALRTQNSVSYIRDSAVP